MQGISQGSILWAPTAKAVQASALTDYLGWLEKNRALTFAGYAELWTWSTDQPEAFWETIAAYFEVRFHQAPSGVLSSREMPGAAWFPGATLNYAEHVFRRRQDHEALLFEAEAADGGRREERISWSELGRRVAFVAKELRAMGVGSGDCVAGYLSNTPETVIAFLATASLGAIWSNCAVEMSCRGVLERLTQIKPKVLVASEGYWYGGKRHDRHGAIDKIVAGLPCLQHLIVVSDGKAAARRTSSASQAFWHDWSDLFGKGETPALIFQPVPFDHPLWILYSSGTTGKPKAIVHGHGGILLEHLKALSLHLDLKAEDRFFWHTTSGWMMWNWLVSGLLLPGVTIALYDGSPKYPDLAVLWDFVARNDITYFGTSAPFLMACLKEGLRPGARFNLDRLRGIGSTGAPLPVEGFSWIYQEVKRDVLLGSASGGTDVCTAFILSQPHLPVVAGKLQCLGLGAKIEAWNDAGRSVFGEVGELVLTAPFPSMPLFLWGDTDGSRLRASYYEKFPGIWSHGDWIEIDAVGGPCVIHGRSDATLNRGGVRMGTAEFYAVVEEMPEVVEALVIDTGGLGRQDHLLLFLTLRAGATLDDALRTRINQKLKTEASPRHVPDFIYQVPGLPRTLNGKKLEVPLKRIMIGMPIDQAVNRGTLANPETLDFFMNFRAHFLALAGASTHA